MATPKKKTWPAIPDANQVRDPVSKRVLVAMREMILWIKQNWPEETTTVTPETTSALSEPAAPVQPVVYYGGMSVQKTGATFSFKNDEETPGANKVYGTDGSGDKGWKDDPEELNINHPFRFDQTTDSGGLLSEGTLRIDGVEVEIDGLPATIASTDGLFFWVEVDLDAGTASWEKSGTDYADGDETTAIFPILELTVDGSDNITDYSQRRWSDIVIISRGEEPETCADHPFKFTATDGTSGTLTTALCLIDGVSVSAGFVPSTLSGISTSKKYWVSVDLSAKTATWATGSNYATGSSTVMIVPILEFTCAAGVITSYIQCQWSDLVFSAAASNIVVPDHSFKFTKTSATGGTITAGNLIIGGVGKTITSLPTTLSGVTVSTKYYITIEIATATATWASTTGSYPSSDSDTEVWPMLEITCVGSVITTWIQRQHSDIHFTLVP